MSLSVKILIQLINCLNNKKNFDLTNILRFLAHIFYIHIEKYLPIIYRYDIIILQGKDMAKLNMHNFINDLRELLISMGRSNIEDIECYCIAYYWYLLEQQQNGNEK